MKFKYEDDRIEYLDRKFHEAREHDSQDKAEAIQAYIDRCDGDAAGDALLAELYG